MKALQLDIHGRPTITDVPLPDPGKNEILLRVTHCAICRTDARMSLTGHRDLCLPRIPGHEICGLEERTGSPFVVWPGQVCGVCDQCLSGRENLCEHMRIIGFHRDGGFAELLAVPKSCLIPIPQAIPFHVACLAEPIACTRNALELAGLSDGKHVLIFGAGPVGLMMSLTATSMGADVHLVECDRLKLDRSREFREHIQVQSSTSCPKSGFDVAINAAPSMDAFREGISSLKPGALFCLFSGITGESPLPSSLINEIHYRQLRIVGAYGCKREHMTQAVRLISDHTELMELLVEELIGLEKSPDALRKILSDRVMRYVVQL